MLDTLSPTKMQRTIGRAQVGMNVRGVQDLHQSGAAKAILPRIDGVPEVIFLNTSGGITGGDRLRYGLSVAAEASAVGTTQTAERAYRSTGGAGAVETHLQVGPGAALDWLPQETILFEASHLERQLTVDLAPDARFLFSEMLVFGRSAMGERISRLHLIDRRVIRRAGRVIYAEPLEIGPEAMARRAMPAVMSDAVAVATIGVFCPDVARHLSAVRDAVAGVGLASAWEGKLIVRMMAPDAFALRKAVARCLVVLRQAPVPRVWQM